jgi:hypothetical protein
MVIPAEDLLGNESKIAIGNSTIIFTSGFCRERREVWNIES